MYNKKDKGPRRRGVINITLKTLVGFGNVMKNFEGVYIHTNIWMAGRNLKR